MDKVRAYAQLLRIPNVFTAMADVCMGWMVAGGFLSDDGFYLVSLESVYDDLIRFGPVITRSSNLILLALLLGGTVCLYSAGMVWNDFFDVEEDRRDRPFRPIPSGRVSRRSAGILGGILLLLGVSLAGLCLPLAGRRPLAIAGTLAACVLLYDGWLKRTWAGPLGMGSCRFLNVLLGLVAIPDANWDALKLLFTDFHGTVRGDALLLGLPGFRDFYLATIIGVYIVGVTWFARTEAAESNRESLLDAASLIGVAAVMALGLAVGLLVINHLEGTLGRRPDKFMYFAFRLPVYLFLLFYWGSSIGNRIEAAVRQPQPALVQAAVKHCILGLVLLDALLAFVVIGWPGLLILLLLPPALLLGRWVYST